MAHFLLYFPGVTGANPKHFVDVGLENLLGENEPGPSFFDVINGGPDGGAGMIATWLDPAAPEKNPRAGNFPDEQHWQPAKPDPERNFSLAGRYWLGWEKARPPRPLDLARVNQIAGVSIELGDGQEWMLPNAFRLPHRFDLDDSGEMVRKVVRTHEALFERTRWAFRTVEAALATGDVDWPPVVAYLVEMLAVNYRMPRDLAFALALFNEGNMLSAAAKTTDLDRLREIREELQKKTELASTPPG